jgi:hypothetical protein
MTPSSGPLGAILCSFRAPNGAQLVSTGEMGGLGVRITIGTAN